MPTLEEMMDLKKRYEDAQAAKAASERQDVLAGLASSVVNRPTYASIMLGQKPQRMDFSALKGASFEKPEDIADIYKKYEEAKLDRENKLGLKDKELQAAQSQRQADQQFQRDLLKEKSALEQGQEGRKFEQQKQLKMMDLSKSNEDKSPESVLKLANQKAGTDMIIKANEQAQIKTLLEEKARQFDDLLRNKKDSEARSLGYEMGKLLNSQAGKDALGVEEGNRILANLETKMFNFTGPGATFGKDLPGFSSQVKNSLKTIDESIRKSRDQGQALIRGEEYVSKPLPPLNQKDSGFLGVGKAQASGKIRVSNGQETLMIDPNDLEDAKKDGFKEF